MSTLKGSCHCGAVQYEIEKAPDSGMECNCSMCHRKGTILAFIPETEFKLISGEHSLTNYQFNKHHIDHTFCKTCGVTSFLTGKTPTGETMKAINLRCLENFDLSSVKRTHVDGRSF